MGFRNCEKGACGQEGVSGEALGGQQTQVAPWHPVSGCAPSGTLRESSRVRELCFCITCFIPKGKPATFAGSQTVGHNWATVTLLGPPPALQCLWSAFKEKVREASPYFLRELSPVFSLWAHNTSPLWQHQLSFLIMVHLHVCLPPWTVSSMRVESLCG